MSAILRGLKSSSAMPLYRRHRTFARGLLGAVVSVDLMVACFWLRPAVFGNGLLLTVGVIAYLAAFPFTRWGTTVWKKPFAALLFTAGTFLIAWTGAGHPVRQLVWPAAAFCSLCLGNLLMIEHWSRALPRGNSGLWRGWVWLPVLCVALASVQSSSWITAIIFSAAGLCALARWGRKISGDVRCVLADALLLTSAAFSDKWSSDDWPAGIAGLNTPLSEELLSSAASLSCRVLLPRNGY